MTDDDLIAEPPLAEQSYGAPPMVPEPAPALTAVGLLSRLNEDELARFVSHLQSEGVISAGRAEEITA